MAEWEGREGGGDGGGHQPPLGAEGKVRQSRVDPETVSYLTEIVERSKDVDDDEEKSLMLTNALDEISGNELRVLTDAECSHLIEGLIAQGSISVSVKLLAVFSDGDKFFELSGSMFGSHVAEKLLMALSDQLESATEAETSAAEEMLTALVQAVVEYMMDFVMDRSASHVVRTLLNTLCGRQISAPSKPPPGSSSAKKKKKKKALTGLAAKVVMDTSHEGPPPPPTFPKLVDRLVQEVLNASQDLVSQLVQDTYANPFLQVLVASAQHDSLQMVRLVARLLGASASQVVSDSPMTVLSEVASERVTDLCHHKVGSHLMELVVKLLPGDALAQLYSSAFEGRLQDLCMHPTANFVVQSLIASATTPKQVDSMLEELGPNISLLLSSRRSGVVAALVAACGRVGSGETDMCRALSRGLAQQSTPHNGDQPREKGLVERLVTMDTLLELGTDNDHEAAAYEGERFSTAGCAMLAAILRYPPVACQKFTESFNLLGGRDLIRVAGDAGGSRVLESFVESNTNPKIKVKLMKKLKGNWAHLVMRGGGAAITVERCYDSGKMADKEAIVAEIAAKETEVSSKHYGPALVSRLGISAYKRDPEGWRRRVGSSSNVKTEFMKMFDDGGSAPAEPSQRSQAPVEEEPTTSGREEGAAEATGFSIIEHMLLTGAEGSGKKKKKGRKAAPDGEDVVGAEEAEATETIQKKAKKKRRRPDGDEEAAKGRLSADGDDPQADKEKKRKKQAAADSVKDEADEQAAGVESKKKKHTKKHKAKTD